MPSAEPEPQAARRQLERVLGSPGFARNERLSRFLRFVVERRPEGRDQDLKESVVALEIFGRRRITIPNAIRSSGPKQAGSAPG